MPENEVQVQERLVAGRYRIVRQLGHNVATRTTVASLAGGGGQGIAFSPGGATLAIGGGGPAAEVPPIRLWDVASRTVTARMSDPGGDGVNSVAFSPDGRTLAAGDESGTAYLRDVATGRTAASLTDPGHSGLPGLQGLAFSPSGTMLATGDGSGHIDLWAVRSG